MVCDTWECGHEATVTMPTPGLYMRPGAALPRGIKARRDESLVTVPALHWCDACWLIVQQGKIPQVGCPEPATETLAAMLLREEAAPDGAWGGAEEGADALTVVLTETVRKIEEDGDG